VYLAGVTVPASVSVTHDVAEALCDSELVVAAVPSHGCRTVIREAARHAHQQAVFVSATKGLETGTLLRMSEVIAQEVGAARRVVVLPGPTLAIQAARTLPPAVP